MAAVVNFLYVLYVSRVSMASEKPKEDRLRECIAVLQKLTKDLGIPYSSPEVQELKSHFDSYIHDGTIWNGTVSFAAFGRIAVVNLPRKATAQVEVTLRATRLGHKK
jgi:hypothetical protein